MALISHPAKQKSTTTAPTPSPRPPSPKSAVPSHDCLVYRYTLPPRPLFGATRTNMHTSPRSPSGKPTCWPPCSAPPVQTRPIGPSRVPPSIKSSKKGGTSLPKGDRRGMIGLLYGCTFKQGLGDYFHGREVAIVKLGLKEEDLDEVVRRVVKELKAK